MHALCAAARGISMIGEISDLEHGQFFQHVPREKRSSKTPKTSGTLRF
jgi:hypothetical protein